MARATTTKKHRGAFAAETVEEARERVEALAKDTRKALARRVAPVEKRVDAFADDAKAAVARGVDSLEERLEERLVALRRTAAGCLHEAANMVTRAEKRVAPPPRAKRVIRKRAKAASARMHAPVPGPH